MKKVILVVSFGTTHPETLNRTIGAIERDIRLAYPDYEVRRAFTSGMVIRRLAKREGIEVDSVEQALERLVSECCGEVILQPTHVMNGFENDAMLRCADAFRGEIPVIRIGTPLLTSADDYRELVEELSNELAEIHDMNTSVVFMGHGSSHFANASYPALAWEFEKAGCTNVLIGTVEGYPALADVLKRLKASGNKRVCLSPLMVVAGDHAANDMAGDDAGSWKSQFEARGCTVHCIMKGLGEYESIRAHYLRHLKAVMDENTASKIKTP